MLILKPFSLTWHESKDIRGIVNIIITSTIGLELDHHIVTDLGWNQTVSKSIKIQISPLVLSWLGVLDFNHQEHQSLLKAVSVDVDESIITVLNLSSYTVV